MSQDLVSVVIPVYNESQNLPELVDRVLKACGTLSLPYEFIMVDDGSRDHSREVIEKAVKENKNVIGIFLNRNYGQHNAILAGFSKLKGNYIVTLDADLQNPPEEILKLVEKLKEGYDVVAGKRVARDDSFFRKFFSYLTNRLTVAVTGISMTDYGCMLRGYSRSVIDAILQCNERSTFIPVLANMFAKKTIEIDVAHHARTQGESKYSIFKLINLYFDLVTCMTSMPLRVLTFFGFVISAVGLGLAFFLVVLRLIFGDVWAVHGVFTLFAVLFFFIGAQFIGLGLLGEYIGRIYTDVRARPRFIIHDIQGGDRE